MSSTQFGATGQANVHLQPLEGKLVLHPHDLGLITGGRTARLLGGLWLKAAAAGTAAAAGSGLTAGPFAGFSAAVLAFSTIFVLSHVVEHFGDWSALVPDQAERELHVYSAIQGQLARAQVPAQVRAVRIDQPGASRTVANRLVITEAPFTIDVFVYPYGTSLYMGWTMYRRRSGPAILRAAWTQFARSLRARPDAVLAAEAERIRALRDAVHAACTAGFKVAVENIDVPLEFGFPAGLPSIDAPRGFQQPSVTHGLAGVPGPTGWYPPSALPGTDQRGVLTGVSLYLADEDGAAELEAAVDRFLAERGFEVVGKSRPVVW